MTWKARILSSLSKNKGKERNYLTLATVCNGSPRARTVVFRGFHEDSILIYTDTRSAKKTEIELEPRVEICWWMAETKEQYRIKGSVLIKF